MPLQPALDARRVEVMGDVAGQRGNLRVWLKLAKAYNTVLIAHPLAIVKQSPQCLHPWPMEGLDPPFQGGCSHLLFLIHVLPLRREATADLADGYRPCKHQERADRHHQSVV